MADTDVEKVGVDDGSGYNGGQQPDSTGVETNPAGGDDSTDVEQADSTTGDATGEQADDKKKKKDNGKVDFPIADAKYRNADGEVVTAATLSPGEDGNDSAAALKLIAVPRPIFDEDGEVDETTGKKPVLYGGWNHRKHNPLKKDDFVEEAEFVNYQAFTFRIKAAVLMEKAKVAERRAKRLKKFGNQTQRKLVDKIAKMREQLAAFEKRAEAENIDIANLDD